MHIDRRIRMMSIFELQSYIWNEGAKRYLTNKVPQAELIGLRYQAGALVLPRSLTREVRDVLWGKTFPLLAPDSEFDDEEIKSAALGALNVQQLRLEDLQVPDTRQLFFKHEERPLFVVPGKLRVNEPRDDEMNRRRLKVNLSFTLPPGAYATLVVRRVLWFAAESKRSEEQVGRSWGRPISENVPQKPAPARARPADRDEEEEAAPAAAVEKPATPKMGFRERQKRKKDARASNRKSAKR